VAEYLNFVAKIHRMPEFPWQCLDFLGTGQVRFSFLILISRFATLDLWFLAASHPCTI
jgi:hypothetical protein